jgi:hypothetical protein
MREFIRARLCDLDFSIISIEKCLCKNIPSCVNSFHFLYMRKLQGITEPYWTQLPEDKRIFWKTFCRILGLFAAVFVTKTGLPWFDWFLTAVTAIFLFVIIESQRSCSRFSPRIRKLYIRIAIFLGRWGITLAGVAFFAQIGALAIFSVFTTMVTKDLDQTGDAIARAMMLVTFIAAALMGTLKAFRQTGFEALISDLPRDALKRLLITRAIKADNFPLFAFIELASLMLTYVYASTVAGIVKVFITLTHQA